MFCHYGQILSAFDSRLMGISLLRSILGKVKNKWEILSAIFLRAAMADLQTVIWLWYVQLDHLKFGPEPVSGSLDRIPRPSPSYSIFPIYWRHSQQKISSFLRILTVCGRNNPFSIKKYTLGASNQEYWMPRQDEYPFFKLLKCLSLCMCSYLSRKCWSLQSPVLLYFKNN